MKAGIIFLFIVSLALPAMAQPADNPIASSTVSAATAPGTVWSISVVGLKGEPLGAVTLELSDESVSTCMSGNWKKARLVKTSFSSLEKQFEDRGYFPTYERDGQTLTIQLNSPGLCDAYLFLNGTFTVSGGKGDYISGGLGGATQLGTFTAIRRPE